MSSPRKLVKDRLVTIVNGITAQNGFTNTVAGVSPVFRSVEQLTSFPHLAVVDGEQSVRPVSEEGLLFQGEVSFAIVGCVKSSGQDALAADCNSLIEDIRTAILQESTSILALLDGGFIRLIADEILPDETGGTGYAAVFVSFGFVWSAP